MLAVSTYARWVGKEWVSNKQYWNDEPEDWNDPDPHDKHDHWKTDNPNV